MKKIKLYFIIAILSAFTGALLNVIWYLAGGDMVTIYSLRYYVTVGFIFGTVVLSTMSFVMVKIRKPIQAYLINATIEVILLVGLFFYQNKDYPQWCNINKWIIILIVQEIISTLFTAYWYRKMHWYNNKLEVKKRDLEKPMS